MPETDASMPSNGTADPPSAQGPWLYEPPPVLAEILQEINHVTPTLSADLVHVARYRWSCGVISRILAEIRAVIFDNSKGLVTSWNAYFALGAVFTGLEKRQWKRIEPVDWQPKNAGGDVEMNGGTAPPSMQEGDPVLWDIIGQTYKRFRGSAEPFEIQGSILMAIGNRFCTPENEWDYKEIDKKIPWVICRSLRR